MGVSIKLVFLKKVLVLIGKKSKEPKRYIPQKNSAAYALLITLYRYIYRFDVLGLLSFYVYMHCTSLLFLAFRAMQKGASHMNKQELIDASEASGLSRTSIA